MKLSIIIINLNNLSGLQETIGSILSQTNSNYEWIFIDRGSTDGSKELIEETANDVKSNISYWCSEPDNGIYNAMNKGIRHATGEYLLFLNSGDYLRDKKVIGDFISLDFKEDIISSHIQVGESIHNIRYSPEEEEIDYDYLKSFSILHPSSFIKRELFVKYGYYDENYKIVSDWKFFLECLIQHSCTYKVWNRFTTVFAEGGISESDEYEPLLVEERKKVLDNFMPRVMRSINKREHAINNINRWRTSVFIKSRTKLLISRFLNKMNTNICKAYLETKRRLYITNDKNANEKIIISFTSWEKRISNVYYVVNSILNNTIKPDMIILNLAEQEFPLKEKSLPMQLQELIKNEVIGIQWHKENTKAFKKFIHTMNNYPNDAIIAIDDDFLYPKDFIETFIAEHKKYPNNPLVGNVYPFLGVNAHCGCASLIKKEHFGRYIEELLDDNIIQIGTDDVFYTFCAYLNRSSYKFVGKTYFVNMEQLNPVDGISENNDIDRIGLMTKYLQSKIKSKYHIETPDLRNPYFSL